MRRCQHEAWEARNWGDHETRTCADCREYLGRFPEVSKAPIEPAWKRAAVELEDATAEAIATWLEQEDQRGKGPHVLAEAIRASRWRKP